MKHTPTDLAILNSIYNRYYEVFASLSDDNKNRGSRNYVPIDINDLGKDLEVDPDIIFGRLYYHLDQKYGYKNDDGSVVHFFSMRVGGDRHCVHFPYLASVLADLRDENKKFRIATSLAVISLIISVASIAISLWPNG